MVIRLEMSQKNIIYSNEMKFQIDGICCESLFYIILPINLYISKWYDPWLTIRATQH